MLPPASLVAAASDKRQLFFHLGSHSAMRFNLNQRGVKRAINSAIKRECLEAKASKQLPRCIVQLGQFEFVHEIKFY
jgi:hypothetical protein